MATYSEKNKAMRLVSEAIKNGELTRPEVCELCGDTPLKVINTVSARTIRSGIVAHHHAGYDKPLDVWWICRKCSQKLRGEKYHSGKVTKGKAITIVNEMMLQKTSKKPTFRQCFAKTIKSNKRCLKRASHGKFCKKHYDMIVNEKRKVKLIIN